MPREKIQLPIALACVLHDRQVLLVRRNEPSRPEIHNKWEFPGGKVEFGEAPELTAIREVREETGNFVRSGPMLPFTYVAVRESTETRLNALVLCFNCALLKRSDQWNLPSKISEMAWIPINQLDPLEIQSGTFQFLRYQLIREGLLPDTDRWRPSLCFIKLRSINSETNRLRGYSVTIESDLGGKTPFHVHQSWGRLPHYGHNARQEFSTRDDAFSFVDRILLTRYNHGYVIVDKSPNFPSLACLGRFRTENEIIQGRLF
jgi:8-oxo-dGTP pyrophosphatase MutT (NUDIX family)/predicted DNA-binding WGR domain protein